MVTDVEECQGRHRIQIPHPNTPIQDSQTVKVYVDYMYILLGKLQGIRYNVVSKVSRCHGV